MIIKFEVVGVPAPQGSTRAFVVQGRAVTTNKGTSAQVAWRDSVANAARDLAASHGQLDGPLDVSMEFRFPMPKSRPKAARAAGRAFKTTAPDIDKLVRSVGDALTAGGLITDDSRICAMDAVKVEVTGWTGAVITLRTWEPDR